MQTSQLLSALCLACGTLLATPASAVQWTGTSGSDANSLSYDFSEVGVLAFEATPPTATASRWGTSC